MLQITTNEYFKCVELARGMYKKELAGSKFVQSWFSGLKAYIHEDDNTMYIVFCGTHFWSLRDWVTDLKIGLGFTPKQLDEALQFVSRNLNQDKRTVITGHSLGCAMAQFTACNINHDNMVCVTFNGVGVAHITKPEREISCYNMITRKDILNRLLRFLPFCMCDHVGKELIVYDDVWCFKSHGNWDAFKEESTWELTKV